MRDASANDTGSSSSNSSSSGSTRSAGGDTSSSDDDDRVVEEEEEEKKSWYFNYLMKACTEGNLSLVENLLKSYEADNCVNDRDKHGNCLIHVACRAGNVAMVGALHRYGADLNQGNNIDALPIEIAIFHDHIHLMEFLYEEYVKDPPLRTESIMQRPIIHYAAIWPRPCILKWLLENGEDPNTVRPGNGETPAHVVSALNDLNSKEAVDCLKSLVDHGADLTLYDKEGRMPIHVVRSSEIFTFFIETLGMSVDTRDRQGWAPLHHVCAAVTGQEKALQYLLEQRADIHALTNDGNTPLHLALRHGSTVASALMTRRLDYNLKDGLGRNSLHLVFAYQRSERYILTFLNRHFLPSGGDIHAANSKTGWTAMHYAVFYNYFDVQQFLLENGVSLCQVNASGQSPVHLVGTKNFFIPLGQEEMAYTNALNRRNSRQRKFPMRASFPLSGASTDKSKTLNSSFVWPAQHKGVYETFLNRGVYCNQRDYEGNLPFFLAASTEWMDATFLMIRLAASQGLFGAAQRIHEPGKLVVEDL